LSTSRGYRFPARSLLVLPNPNCLMLNLGEFLEFYRTTNVSVTVMFIVPCSSGESRINFLLRTTRKSGQVVKNSKEKEIKSEFPRSRVHLELGPDAVTAASAYPFPLTRPSPVFLRGRIISIFWKRNQRRASEPLEIWFRFLVSSPALEQKERGAHFRSFLQAMGVAGLGNLRPILLLICSDLVSW